MKPFVREALIVGISAALTIGLIGVGRLATAGNKSARTALVAAGAGEPTPAHDAGRGGDDVRPILPKRLQALVGRPFELYYDALVIARDPDAYQIEVLAPALKGAAERRRWRVTPEASQVGSHELTVVVRDWKDKVLASGVTRLDVAAVPPPPPRLNLLIVGASNVHQGMYPNALWTVLNEWTRGTVRFFGTHHPKADLPIYRDALPGVFHEGYGGWGWQLFANHYRPGEEKLYKRTASPFVFLQEGRPSLDVPRYLREQGLSGRLDVVVFELGINETFGANPNHPENLQSALESALGWADKLVAAFKDAAPEARILIVVPQPFTRSAPTFMARYGEMNPEYGDPWRHRRIVLTLAKRMIERFDGRDPRISLVPLYAQYDVVDGYWLTDPGHPNEYGGQQVANVLFSAMVHRFR